MSELNATQISDNLIRWLSERFKHEDFWAPLQPLIASAVRVGVNQGVDAAWKAIEGIASDKPYVHWRLLIENASPEERIIFMEAARQQAIMDRVKELKAKAEWLAALKIALQVLIGVLGSLLV